MNLTPDKPNKNDESNPFWDNTNLIAKILYRWKSHGGLFVKAVGNGASIKRMLISRFPYKFKDSKHPPSMHIEFTDSCNLKCVYCNNPHFAHPRQVMAETTFEAIIESLKKSKVDRICMGGGEATLHPKCSLPFRNIQIRANGDIPICQISGSALNKSKRVIAGNIKDNSVNEIWNTGTFQTFRDAHRNRTLEDISICKGCKGC